MKLEERLAWIEKQAAKHNVDMDSDDEDAVSFLLALFTAVLQIVATDEQWEEAVKLMPMGKEC